MNELQRRDTSVAPAALRAALTAAVHSVCALRGDSQGDSDALLAECLALSSADQVDMLQHFRAEAARLEILKRPDAT